MILKNKNMKTNRITTAISVAILAFSSVSSARENMGTSIITNQGNNQAKSIMGQCIPASAEVDLDINNVRAKILNGGDMWWDVFGTNNARYQVPKVTNSDGSAGIGPHSQFASSIWVGGYDAGGQLKEAAQTYRQSGNDYWPGPLSSSATTDAGTCLTWDKFWKINRSDVQAYYNWGGPGNGVGANPVSSTAMDVINSWPAYGPEGQALAPYYDYNGNGIYDPDYGDVPDFDITGTRGCNAQLFGDQCIFWVFNDKGNIHTETEGAAIGLEVQAQAFAFATTDELNNATFLKYKIINKSSFRLDSTFFGIWDDADLGYYLDDYVGCDVERGLGILYNGTQIDGTGQPTAYGANPPAVGIDFFEGPYADPNGIDDLGWPSVPASYTNYGDTTIDNERLGMGKFLYFNNNSDPVNGNPGPSQGGSSDDYYQYLTGTWKNGTPVTYGGNGTTGSVKCDYMFPGVSDPLGFGTNSVAQPKWDEVSAGNVPDDRRFVESAGPFKLQPGAVNTITVGIPWTRATQGGPLASVALLLGADDKAQELFNNCFATLDGPTAPNLTIQELDKEIILYWSNPKGSNNYNENYSEDYDKTKSSDSLYRFQGYQVYQLKDGSVSLTDLQNVSKARLIYQCDKVDGVSQIVNYYNDPTISAMVPSQMVNGSNKGINHSFKVTEDKFANGDNSLINHKTYYYAVIAYGYSPTKIPTNLNALKDYLPYIAGRKNADYNVFTPHSAIPHIPSPEANGTGQNSAYGTGPKLKRIEGQGNGGNILDLTSESVASILASADHRATEPVYQNSHGPVTIKVVDPLNVPEGNFEFKLLPAPTHKNIDTMATWVLTNLTTGEIVNSETTIQLPNEQIINGQPTGSLQVIPKWGLSVNIQTSYDPKDAKSINNSFLEATATFADPSKLWLVGIPDQEGETDMNWIRSGTATYTAPGNVYNDIPGEDDTQVYEKLVSGTWAPYRLCASTPATTPNPLVCRGGPAWGNFQMLTQLKNLASVDVVIDYAHPENWTRCAVLELQEEKTLSIGGARKMDMRNSPSVDKAGRKAGDAGYNAAEGDLNGTTGMGWFPGYAINIETGERLNMAFGEDSWLPTENGNDMLWNPTTKVFSYPGYDPLFGGKHYIYVFGHNGDKTYSADPQMANGLKDIPRYDEGKTIHDLLLAAWNTQSASSTSSAYKREVYSDAMWVSMPLLNTGHSLFETAVKIRLRVSKSYQKGYAAAQAYPTQPVDTALSPANQNFPMYTFSTSDIKTSKNDNELAKSALDIINIVPNPYYAYSEYEQKVSDKIVKITNLPEKCTVTIYSLNGTLIRQFKKDDPKTSLDWDLVNQAKVPVSSGMYIIYINVPNVGEKTLKWFGIMRPLDISAY